MAKEIRKLTKEKMDKTISVLKQELQAVRAGRANPHILDHIMVSYYGTDTPLTQLANVSVPEPRTILIQPYDVSAISDIEKGIMTSDLGMNPSNDGKTIRLSVPLLTEERRKDLVKQVKKMGENAKIALRNERRSANEAFKKMHKDKELTDDDFKVAEDDIQKLIDAHTKTINEMIEHKEVEILEV